MNNFAQHTERNPRFSSSFESILREQQNPSASSDTNILKEDEQPLWLEELLDEPEVDQIVVTRKGHQRSSSDSLAYVDKTYKENKNMTDTQCAKQKLAQRSRIRKVHYIAELERNVQALQAEGSEVSAALNFLDQQNLILGMQNQALKQRLDSLAQERFIKFLEQDLLEKELARLRVLHQSQIQNHHYHHHHHQIHSGGRQINLRGLEHQFSTMSLQNKEARS